MNILGINFSDDLARCILMVGLPYPNATSPELKEKMKYLDLTITGITDTSSRPGKEYYENLCMKAVNQSIGRAIRHKGDYAVILLVDDRYNQMKITTRLPKWIATSLSHPTTFGATYGSIVRFFKTKKT